MIMFDRGEDAPVAINPAEISEVQPSRYADWTLIIMRSGREHMVKEPFASVMAKIEGEKK